MVLGKGAAGTSILIHTSVKLVTGMPPATKKLLLILIHTSVKLVTNLLLSIKNF